MTSTKIDINFNNIARIDGLEGFAKILFPHNRNHQTIFLAIFIELKWSENQLISTLEPITDKYGLSRRVLETVRAKMRRMGIIDHVSRFNKKYGYKEGWVFSNRFCKSLECISSLFKDFKVTKNPNQEKKDRDVFRYL